MWPFSKKHSAKLDRAIDLLLTITEKLKHMSTQFDNLSAQVAATLTAEASAVTLIQGIAAELVTISGELAAAGSDTSKLDALSAQLQTGAASLAAAVTANTPAAPAPIA